MIVMPYMVPCTNFLGDPGECLQVVTENGESPDHIEGFSFAWGTRQTLRVRVSEVKNPPADGSSQRYVQISVLEAARDVSADFQAVVIPGVGTSISGDTLWISEYSRCVTGIGAADSALIASRGERDLIRLSIAMDSTGRLTAVDVLKQTLGAY